MGRGRGREFRDVGRGDVKCGTWGHTDVAKNKFEKKVQYTLFLHEHSFQFNGFGNSPMQDFSISNFTLRLGLGQLV